jgi:hypothetical protein
MKLLIALLFAGLLSPQNIIIAKKKAAGGAPSFVQFNQVTGYGATGTQATPAWTLTVGNIVVGSVNLTTTDVVDSCGNTVTYVDSGTNPSHRTFWFPVASGGSCTVSGAWGGGGDRTVQIVVHEISGASASAPIDQNNTRAQSYGVYSAADSISSLTATTTVPSLCSAFIVVDNTIGSNITAGTGWTQAGDTADSAPLFGEYKQQSGAGSITATAQDANGVADLRARTSLVCVKP